MLFQEATRIKLDWDDPVPSYLAEHWLNWLSSLSEVEKLRFSRCVIPEGFSEGAAELHHFRDAWYLRVSVRARLSFTTSGMRDTWGFQWGHGWASPLQGCVIPEGFSEGTAELHHFRDAWYLRVSVRARLSFTTSGMRDTWGFQWGHGWASPLQGCVIPEGFSEGAAELHHFRDAWYLRVSVRVRLSFTSSGMRDTWGFQWGRGWASPLQGCVIPEGFSEGAAELHHFRDAWYLRVSVRVRLSFTSSGMRDTWGFQWGRGWASPLQGCVIPEGFSEGTAELHHFRDAWYLRVSVRARLSFTTSGMRDTWGFQWGRGWASPLQGCVIPEGFSEGAAEHHHFRDAWYLRDSVRVRLSFTTSGMRDTWGFQWGCGWASPLQGCVIPEGFSEGAAELHHFRDAWYLRVSVRARLSFTTSGMRDTWGFQWGCGWASPLQGCVIPEGFSEGTAELHHFRDAWYLRVSVRARLSFTTSGMRAASGMPLARLSEISIKWEEYMSLCYCLEQRFLTFYSNFPTLTTTKLLFPPFPSPTYLKMAIWWHHWHRFISITASLLLKGIVFEWLKFIR